MHPLQVVLLLCTFLYSTLYSTVVQYLYFKPKMSRSKHKSSSDVAGATVHFKVLYCKIKILFLCLFFMYYLCEKYYKPIIVQYYIADCVSWPSRLTFLDLGTNWTYKHTLGRELVCM